MPLFKLLAITCIQCGNAVRFAYNNGFTASEIRLCGSAMQDSSAISLTQYTPFSVGRVLFPFKISTRKSRNFKISMITMLVSTQGSMFSLTAYKAGYWLENNGNQTYWSFLGLKLNNGEIYRAWIDYADNYIKVTMAPSKMKKPRTPLLEMEIDLYDLADEMYVGFCAANGQRIENHKILSWRFTSNSHH
ncbi:hypothetical protein Patl1_04677 [Pistacia atlantica]|uniref:Uncharacterized protein n=1 Tax=Pistacia atlantica TaxID=434234 RepID=A0ACC1BWU9_9ROSI|nr:hypothetical protein Patl1_04677 [Pistacia atlantica]